MRSLLALGVTALISCNAEAPERKATALEPKVAVLEAKVGDLEKRLDGDAKTIAELQGKVGWLEARVNSIEDDEAMLDPMVKAYEFVKTNAGNLLVVVDNVVPFGDGQKIAFRVGNPLALTFHGFTMKVRYGLRYPVYRAKSGDTEGHQKWLAAYNAWQTSIREKELRVTDSLTPGRWNRVSLVLAPAKPEEIGSLYVRIAIDQVSLLGR